MKMSVGDKTNNDIQGDDRRIGKRNVFMYKTDEMKKDERYRFLNFRSHII